MRAMLGIPFWGNDPLRLKNFMFIRDYMGGIFDWADTFVCGNPPNRGLARNTIARWAIQQKMDVVVMCDADTFCTREALEAAMRGAYVEGGLHLPHNSYRGLTQTGTHLFMEGETEKAFERLDAHLPSDDPRTSHGGVMVMRPYHWIYTGGMPAFPTWGFEDIIFAVKCRTLFGQNYHYDGYVTHLWHPTECVVGGESYNHNISVCKEYEAADGDRSAIVRLDDKYRDYYFA